MTNIWNSGFIAKIILGANWRIELIEDAFQFNELIVKWSDIKNVELKKGFIWNEILVVLDEEVILITGLSKKLSSSLNNCLEIIGIIQRAIILLDLRFKEEFYIRNSEFLYMRTMIPTSEKLIRLFKSKEINADILIDKINQERLLKIAKGNKTEIVNWNATFVKNEMHKYADYFNSIESQPLTSEQIVASIIVEDNNLLIAAAGSGKTSVIISKLGYLIQKKYAKPEDILVLSFNNKVRDEINHRINNNLKSILIDQKFPVIQTFHSYGYSVIKDGKLNKRTPAWIGSEAKAVSHLKSIFYTVLKKNNEIAAEIALFLTLDDVNEDDEVTTIFETKETNSDDRISDKAHRDINSQSIAIHQTLSGIFVRSLQELKICNWLTIFNVEFKYEKNLTIEGVDDYRPDFYYTKIKCWHEHFGINKLGKAPDHFSRNGKMSYENIVKLKRQALNKAKVRWFETTSADFYDNTWDIDLDKKLREFGENPNFIGWERYLELVKNFNKENKDKDFSELPLINLLLSSIKHFKNNRFTFSDIDKKITNIKRKERYRRFFKIFKAVYEEYENDLLASNNIDFEDMLNESIKLIYEHKVIHSFKFILVDEFQDMSNSRARLIQALKRQNPDTILFGVGDDWQSIYRFAGSDSSNMIEFENKFGFSYINKLSKTFRFNQGIADISSEFILKNNLQITKEVTAINTGRKNRVRYISHEKIKNFPIRNTEGFDRALLNQLESIKSHAIKNNIKLSVALLGRYHYSIPDNLNDLIYQYQKWLDINFSTIHSSKGLGWDFVIILGVDEKFPSTKSDDEVLSLFMTQPDIYPFAEERRLFYVALTRAKIAVILLGNQEAPSIFLAELKNTNFQDVISINVNLGV